MAVGGHMAQRVERGHGVNTSGTKRQTCHVSLEQGGGRRGLLSQPQLRKRRVHTDHPVLFRQKPGGRLAGAAAQVDDEAVGWQFS